MTEAINNIFGIKNEISAPILISLIVFIIGSLGRLVVNSYINYSSRRQVRISFRNIINEIILKSRTKSKYVRQFIDTLKIENDNNWTLKFTRVTYLELAFKQDFNAIYNSFIVLFKFRQKRKLRQKAFNRVWALLENLKFNENQIIKDFESFAITFNKYETSYYKNLEDLRQENEKMMQPYIGKKILVSDFTEDTFNYIIARDKIFKAWQDINEQKRRHRFIVYENLVVPLYQLNLKNQQIELTLKQNRILLAVIHEYEQMTNFLSVNRQIFHNYLMIYKTADRLLSKCYELLK